MYKVKAITRLQKFLNAIAGNGEAPEPITDSEKLLANIAEGGGGSSLPAYTSADNGATLGIVDGALAWKPSFVENFIDPHMQIIPVHIDTGESGLVLSTNITPKMLRDGYSVQIRFYPDSELKTVECVPETEALGQVAFLYTGDISTGDSLYGLIFGLFATRHEWLGTTFMSEIQPLDNIGQTGKLGVGILEPTVPYDPYTKPYTVTLYAWDAPVLAKTAE